MGDDFEVIKNYYNYSNAKTKEIMDLLSKDDIEEMKRYISGGGINP